MQDYVILHAQVIFQNNAVRYVLFQVNALRLLVN